MKNPTAKTAYAHFGKRLLSFALALLLALPAGILTAPEKVSAASGKLSLSAAKNVAVARSSKIDALELQITTKQASRDSAVRSLRAREKNMRTFRWSPLLNFKFPTKPSEAEAFEFQFKPTQLEYQIKDIQHKITDEELAEYEKVSNLYIQIIQAQQQIDFVNERLKNVQKAYEKAQVKQQVGEMSEEQVKKLSDRLSALKSEKSAQETKLQRGKEKLGKEVGFDITTGYTFDNAFATAEMSRKNIEYLQTYALERDHTVYEAQQAADLALLSLQTNYSLFSGQYGAYIGTISTYVQQAMNGSDVNQKAYNTAYNKFLEQIDEPWSGSYRILFISFPKSYLKGDSDGMNWIEDDPKVLFTDTMDYVSARKELENTKDDIKTSIEEGYDTYAEARKTYLSANTEYLELQSSLAADEIRNLMGELTDDEYDAEKQEFEAAETSLNEALGAYSQTLYSYDRTCCGGVSQFLVMASGVSGSDGSSNKKKLDSLEGITKTGAHYSLRSIVADAEFLLTIDVPEYNDVELLPDGSKNPDYFPWSITDFELRVDGKTVGEKTPKDGAVRHLKFDTENADSVVVRLWNGREFIDDVVIDPTVSYGPLDIVVAYETPDGRDGGVLGTYEVLEDTTTDMIKIEFTFDQEAVKSAFGAGKEAAFYNLSADRTLYLFSDHLVEASEPFSYLSFIRGDLAQLTLRLFDSEGTFLGGARFDTVNNRLVKDADVTAEDMQQAALEELAARNKQEEINAELARAQASLSDAEASGDTTTADYYRNRIAELQEQLDSVYENLTDEDLEKVRTEQADELSSLTAEKVAETDTSDEEKAAKAEQELKRQQILRDAAENLVRQEKYEAAEASLNDQLSSLDRQLKTLNAQKKSGDPDVLAQIAELTNRKNALEKELAEVKAAGVGADAFAPSEQEIQEKLSLHAEDVFAAAQDDLRDFDLTIQYGEAYEIAKAQAEFYGIELTDDNLDYLIKHADDLKQAEALRKSAEAMEKNKADLEDQIIAINALPDGDPRKASAKDTLSQLQKVHAAYEKQMDKIHAQLAALDPTKKLAAKA